MSRGRTLFVIDDDVAIRASLKFSLEIDGFTVRCYSSGKEFLNEAELNCTGCIVIDYHLLDMNGLEVLHTRRRRGIELPAILITSNVNAMLRGKAAAAAACVVEKPFVGNPLLQAINLALKLDLPTTLQ